MAQSESYEQLSETFSGLFAQAVDILAEISPEGNDRLAIRIPSGKEMEEMTVRDLASVVAETSNIYSKAARLAGITKAELKKAQQDYKDKYKSNKFGKNEDERDRNAIEATVVEVNRLIAAEQVFAAADYVENAARVASETARKLLDKVESLKLAEAREEHGHQRMGSDRPIDF